MLSSRRYFESYAFLTIIGNKATLLFVTLNISSEQFQKMKQFIYLVISVISIFAILDLIVRIYSIIHSRPSLRDKKEISNEEDLQKYMLEHPFDMPLEGKADIPLKSMFAKRSGNNTQQKKNEKKKKAKKNKTSEKNYNKVVDMVHLILTLKQFLNVIMIIVIMF